MDPLSLVSPLLAIEEAACRLSPTFPSPTSTYFIYHLLFVTDTDTRLAVVFIICRVGRV